MTEQSFSFESNMLEASIKSEMADSYEDSLKKQRLKQESNTHKLAIGVVVGLLVIMAITFLASYAVEIFGGTMPAGDIRDKAFSILEYGFFTFVGFLVGRESGKR